MTILVTGGAGYIGSHMLLELSDAVVYDDLTTGHRDAIPDGVKLYTPPTSADVTDTLLRVFDENRIDTIMHFAASTSVKESMNNPIRYYQNNVEFTRMLLCMAMAHDVKNFIYSSTAAVYGEPNGSALVCEDHPTKPMSPYGGSKLAAEFLVKDVARAYGMRFGILRYFNVAGADPNGQAWDRRANPEHLIGAVVEVMRGDRPYLEVYGTDYETRDGTAERDFVHVMDVVSAHKAVLQHFRRRGVSTTVNVGYGQLFTVKEVINAAQQILGRKLAVRPMERRPGDIPSVGADSDRLALNLGWYPQYRDMRTILTHAYEFNHVKAPV